MTQREAIAEVQQYLYDHLIAPVEHGSMESDDDSDVLIRQADSALGLAWKLAGRG